MAEPEDPLLVLICSVALEADPVRARMTDIRPREVGRRSATMGRLGGRAVLLLPAGMGKVNAAQGLTAALESGPAHGVIGFGVGGAYPGTGLAAGAVALASHEIYGDEGVEAPHGWMSTGGIGIPLLERRGERLFNEIPLDPDRVRAARRALVAAGIGAAVGPFVTVSSCSGTERRGAELEERFAAVCETMEGAACAHVAALYEVPYLEVRGISNRVEDRDLSRWRLHEAAEAAARAVEAVVTNYEC